MQNQITVILLGNLAPKGFVGLSQRSPHVIDAPAIRYVSTCFGLFAVNLLSAQNEARYDAKRYVTNQRYVASAAYSEGIDPRNIDRKG